MKESGLVMILMGHVVVDRLENGVKFVTFNFTHNQFYTSLRTAEGETICIGPMPRIADALRELDEALREAIARRA